ncbi:Geranylgeranyl transferase type-2 subunit alpha, partial [Stegodyphus mimosarum]
MRALNDTKFGINWSDYMEQLIKVDASRRNYYKDLGSKFVIEDIIETLSVEADVVNFSNKKLTSLHHFDQLLLIEKIDLSSNYLTSIYPLCFLICVKDINLDNNQLTNLDGLENLQNLKSLSVKKN